MSNTFFAIFAAYIRIENRKLHRFAQTTENLKTHDTTTETTATQTTETQTTTELYVFEVGDKIEFQAVAWVLFSNDSKEEQVRWLKTGEKFLIVDRKINDDEDFARYTIVIEEDDEEDNEKQYVIHIGDVKYFKKIS